MGLTHDLEKIGLSDKEAKVYLATLELGQSSVQDIAKKSLVNRATAYVILDSLISKGLISTYEKGKKTYYIAETPEVLNSILEVKKKDIEENQRLIKKIMPDLRLIHNRQEDKPVVRFFEGKEGVLTMYSEMFSKDTKVMRNMYSLDLVQKRFSPMEREVARKKRIDRGIKTKVLYNYKSGKRPSGPDGERIKLSDKEFPILTDLALFDDKVRIASLANKLSGVIIQDKDIYQTLVSLFDLAWEAAKAREEKESKK